MAVTHITDESTRQESTYEVDRLTLFLGNAAKVALVTGATAAAVVGIEHLVRHARYGDIIKDAMKNRQDWYDKAEQIANATDAEKYAFHQHMFNPEYAKRMSKDGAEFFQNISEKDRYHISPLLEFFSEEGLKGIGDRQFANRIARNLPKKLSPLVIGGISALVGAVSIPFVTKDKEKPSTIIASPEPQERTFGELPTKEKSALPVHDAVIMAG